MFTLLRSSPPFSNVASRIFEPGESFSSQITEGGGTVLETKSYTYEVNATNESDLEAYIKRNYESWEKVAEVYGEDAHPVFVSGFHMTDVDWKVTMDGQEHNPSLDGQQSWPQQEKSSLEPSPTPLAEPGNVPEGIDQCVFVRYYTMRLRPREPSPEPDPYEFVGSSHVLWFKI